MVIKQSGSDCFSCCEWWKEDYCNCITNDHHTLQWNDTRRTYYHSESEMRRKERTGYSETGFASHCKGKGTCPSEYSYSTTTPLHYNSCQTSRSSKNIQNPWFNGTRILVRMRRKIMELWWRRWKVNYRLIQDKLNCFVILFLTFTSIFHQPGVNGLPVSSSSGTDQMSSQSYISHSQNSECDWTGRGTTTTISSKSTPLVQTVILRCSRGSILWKQPKGGLKVTIIPNVGKPFKLCLENESGRRHHRILLEETEPGATTASSTSGPSDSGSGLDANGFQRKLLSILTKSNSNCYRIENPSAVLYIESHGESEKNWDVDVNTKDELLMNDIEIPEEAEVTTKDDETGSSNSNLVSISYEVESLREDGDPCRPCSESEVLQTFCSSDVVARGSILQVRPGKKYDSIYVKSDLVLHQNHPVFSPFENLQKFLEMKSSRFDMDKPQRFSASVKGQIFGGIVNHPSSCSSSVGPGDFLWLIKFRFGIPLIDCVIYWDKWVDIARTKQGECPLMID